MKNKIFFLLLLFPFITGCANINLFDKNNGWDIVLQESFEVNDTLNHVNNKECKVILIYGQSNATGCSYSMYLKDSDEELYDLYDKGFDNVKINYVIEGNSLLTDNQFRHLNFENTNSGYSFGPEMGIGEVYSKTYPNDDIFIIKYSWGGSSLSNEWLTSKGNRNIMYKNAMNFTTTSLDYLKNIGYKINIEGICWMQGEADSCMLSFNNYLENTKKIVSYFRDDLSKYQDTIKFVDAYIEDISAWPMYKQTNNQKLEFSLLDENNFVIDTIELGLTTNLEPKNGPDIYHYDSKSMATLGQEFANIIIENSK